MYIHIHKEIVCTCIQNNLYTYMYFTLSISISIYISTYLYIYIYMSFHVRIHRKTLTSPTPRTAHGLRSSGPSPLRRYFPPRRRSHRSLEGRAMDPMDPMVPWVKGFHQPSQWMSMGYLARLWVIEQNHKQNCYSLDVWYGDLMVVFHGIFHGDLMVVQSSKQQGCEWIYPAW